MKKKLLAVAIAGALVAPAAALAQVTISGAIQASVDRLRANNNPTKLNTVENRLNDESSSIIFTMREDLGGGMAGLVVVDVKPNIDTSAIAASGQSYIGLATPWGRFTGGRHNWHFFKTPWDGYGLSAPLKVHPAGLIDFAGGGKIAVANATRTNNGVMYSSPVFGGFAIDAGYSFNPTSAGAEADMTAGSTMRNGRALYLNPAFTFARNYHIAYSFWDAKYDAGSTAAAPAATSDQRSNSLYGYATFGALKVGAIFNRTELRSAGTETKIAERDAWSVPVRFSFGQMSILAHYTEAKDDEVLAGDNSAKLLVLTLAHSLSKRTHVSLSYGKLDNAAAGAYDLFTNASGGGLASVNSGTGLGEDQRLLSFGIRHNF